MSVILNVHFVFTDFVVRMVVCFAVGCSHYQDVRNCTCRFFRFPADERQRKRWIEFSRWV